MTASRQVSWVVSLEQTRPHERQQLELFAGEDDALRYAETYMSSRPGAQLSKRVWVLFSDGPNLRVVVRRRYNDGQR